MALHDDCGHCTYEAWTWQRGDQPGDLALETVEMPELAANEAIVRNAAIGLNPVDWKVLGSLPGWQPGHIPGVDGAGTVIAVGEDVHEGWLGRRVAYHQTVHKAGSFAEYTVVAARALMEVPDALDLAVAASFPCPAMTAWLALEKLPVHAGAPLLVSGAGGAVGNYLTQLASARGFAVTAQCNPRHWDRLRALGATDFRSGPLQPGDVWPEPDAGRFFAVIDCISADHVARLAPALQANGHLVCIQGRLERWPCGSFGPAWSMHEVALGALHRFGSDDDWERIVQAGEKMLSQLATGCLQAEAPVVGEFAELPRLLEALKHRQFTGKPLIRLRDSADTRKEKQDCPPYSRHFA